MNLKLEMVDLGKVVLLLLLLLGLYLVLLLGRRMGMKGVGLDIDDNLVELLNVVLELGDFEFWLL